MIGGTGPNQLIGRAGQVKFKPSTATDLIFAGTPGRATGLRTAKTPPSGTFYVYKKGRLIPVPLSRDLSAPHDALSRRGNASRRRRPLAGRAAATPGPSAPANRSAP